jgi:23S rRNA (guanosine2251-2'-O)-methyltransferase
VHQGLLIEAKPLDQPRLDQIAKSGIVVLLDQVTDPHNVGAILRTCAAFNVTALVATARHSPEASAVLFKSASGAYEHVPFVKVTNLSRAMQELKDDGFRMLGLDSEAPDDIAAVDRTPPVAIVLGAEGKGLRQLTRDSCDHLVRLDMNGPIKKPQRLQRLRRHPLRPHPLSKTCGSAPRALWKASQAGLAQLVEHLICNQGVRGSSPLAGTRAVSAG